MLGHVFWSENFSRDFMRILEQVYDEEATKGKLWEDIYREHIRELKMKIRRYGDEQIYEFDSLDELRLFDHTYCNHSGSAIMQKLAGFFSCREGDITNLMPVKDNRGIVVGTAFDYRENRYQFLYVNEQLIKVGRNE